jgi:8-oxo-dGTP pyrophosphatase MutT (NUDIX family)
MPAGQIDESLEPDDDAVRAVARRELREETATSWHRAVSLSR